VMPTSGRAARLLTIGRTPQLMAAPEGAG
jgi:hypothetical protein